MRQGEDKQAPYNRAWELYQRREKIFINTAHKNNCIAFLKALQRCQTGNLRVILCQDQKGLLIGAEFWY